MLKLVKPTVEELRTKQLESLLKRHVNQVGYYLEDWNRQVTGKIHHCASCSCPPKPAKENDFLVNHCAEQLYEVSIAAAHFGRLVLQETTIE